MRIAQTYLNEQINYGGEVRTRALVILELQENGTSQKYIDAYMMGAKSIQEDRPPFSNEETMKKGFLIVAGITIIISSIWSISTHQNLSGAYGCVSALVLMIGILVTTPLGESPRHSVVG